MRAFHWTFVALAPAGRSGGYVDGPAADADVFFGAMMQDAPPGQSVGVEIECVSARWSRS
jgi:hypothetical protein